MDKSGKKGENTPYLSDMGGISTAQSVVGEGTSHLRWPKGPGTIDSNISDTVCISVLNRSEESLVL